MAFLGVNAPCIHHRYISSKGLVSAKHESHTSFTTLTAVTSSLQFGRFIKESTARFRTHSWCCCVMFHLFLVKNSLVHLHSPLKLEARIWWHMQTHAVSFLTATSTCKGPPF